MTTSSDSPASDRGSDRTVGITVSGWAFVVLLLLSAGMADVPDRSVATATARSFYEQHTGVIWVAQLVGLLAAGSFWVFSRRLAGRWPAARAVRLTGALVAAAAVLTAVPVLVLAGTAGSGSGSGDSVRLLLALGDATDVLLFLCIAGFAAAVALATRSPAWQVLCALCGGVCVVRAVLLALGSSTLELVAPMAFVALVAALSTRPSTL